jgi:hypothetical protein
MFYPDLDDTDHYPLNGTLEEKAAHSLEQGRRQFYWQKRMYLETREGGARHTATLRAHGVKSAEMMAQQAEMNFKAYCTDMMLTPEGETTDPNYPVDRASLS